MHLIVWKPLHQPSATLVSATNWHKPPVRNCQVRTLISLTSISQIDHQSTLVFGVMKPVPHDLCKIVLVR
jgi:hypothetical protein